MVKRLFLVAVCIFALPFLFAQSNESTPGTGPGASTLALAGHTGSGGWCQDGTPGCISDIIGVSRRPSREHHTSPATSTESSTGLALATVLLVIGLLIARMRL